MATGTYGIVRPADVNPSDVEITVFYAPNRNSSNTRNFKLASGNLIQIDNPNKTGTGFEIFGGLYTLKLPLGDFSAKGIYTIVIKPVEIRTKIVDCDLESNCFFSRASFLDNHVFFVIQMSLKDYSKKEPKTCDPTKVCTYTFKVHLVDLINNSRSVYESEPVQGIFEDLKSKL